MARKPAESRKLTYESKSTPDEVADQLALLAEGIRSQELLVEFGNDSLGMKVGGDVQILCAFKSDEHMHKIDLQLRWLTAGAAREAAVATFRITPASGNGDGNGRTPKLATANKHEERPPLAAGSKAPENGSVAAPAKKRSSKSPKRTTASGRATKTGSSSAPKRKRKRTNKKAQASKSTQPAAASDG